MLWANQRNAHDRYSLNDIKDLYAIWRSGEAAPGILAFPNTPNIHDVKRIVQEKSTANIPGKGNDSWKGLIPWRQSCGVPSLETQIFWPS